MDFSYSDKNWLLRHLPDAAAESRVSEIARSLDFPDTLARILVLRGLTEKNVITEFLAPVLNQLPRPTLMKGMKEAVAILCEATELRKPVTVYGDFDADGVTSTAVLALFFTELGLPFETYIPDRLTEGYGLNSEAIKKIYEANMHRWGTAGVLLTADCGISDAEAVNKARGLGFRVIITDHHKPPLQLPDADAIMNPLQPGCPFPCKDLAGVGVAFYLILGLRSELVTNGHWPESKVPNLKSYMDLVAIGTVADQVPLTGCNRIIVKAGLEIMNQSVRLGLQQLLGNAMGSGSGVSTEDIAFRMAPRINAAGRIGSARRAVELMTAQTIEKAQQLAAQLEEANNLRKSIESDILAEAVQMVSDEILESANSLVLYKGDWHPGVLGIVASRICDRFNRPTILLTDYEMVETEESRLKLIKGSGRSVEGIDLHQAVASCDGLLHRFGGHVGAVGLTLSADNLDSFREYFDRAVTAQAPVASLTPSLLIDAHASLSDITDQKFLTAYSSMAPFGNGNSEPVFCLFSQKITNYRIVGVNHLKFTVTEQDKQLNGIGFGFGGMIDAVVEGPVDLAFTLRLNTFMGQEKWEINLVDLRPAERAEE